MSKLRLTFIFIAFLYACNQNDDDDMIQPCSDPEIAYFSNSYAFIADDGGSRLIIPMDFNLRPDRNGYSIEFKSWCGTPNDRQINYVTQSISIEDCRLPMETWEHASSKEFNFDEYGRKITCQIENSPQLGLKIPPESEWPADSPI